VIEHLPSKCKALSSNSRTVPPKKRKEKRELANVQKETIVNILLIYDKLDVFETGFTKYPRLALNLGFSSLSFPSTVIIEMCHYSQLKN
jgi:hypothetical protein